MELLLFPVRSFFKRRVRLSSRVRVATVLLAGALLCSCATPSAREPVEAPMAKEGLRVIAAVYGADSSFADVTPQVRDALDAQPGQFTMSNAFLGFDPLPQHAKSLAILYSYQGHRYLFAAKEDNIVSLATMMDASSPAEPPLPRRLGRVSGPDGDLVVVAAVYGSSAGYGDATLPVVQSLKTGVFRADNDWFQHDPNPGEDKALIIVYRFKDRRALFAATEGGKVSYARLVLEAREAAH